MQRFALMKRTSRALFVSVLGLLLIGSETSDEMAVLAYELKVKMDTNKDEKIDKSELAAFFKSQQEENSKQENKDEVDMGEPHPNPEGEAESTFDTFDLDNDGILDNPEFFEAMNSLMTNSGKNPELNRAQHMDREH
eukprot:TRINITY_DN1908_c0_g2_i3.p1 TRINITY_DN1908_c0_g2~~TRINITY_DN1908_c0_g2_i3.p1  ORF type:complete len:137 (-),score=21.44 TRINITY_DN1908_c0_g2_i3:217-627(-)